MKLGRNMCPNKIFDKFKNGSGWKKNMAARGRGNFPIMAIVKLVHTVEVKFIVQSSWLSHNICSNDILIEFEYGLIGWKTWLPGGVAVFP